MISFEPLIYTRTKNVDYRFVATPQALKGSRCWDFVEHHIRMVLADEGSRGPLLGRRWHIMSIDGYLLIGIATYEFERLDYTGCPIRGYYGILLKSVVEVMPSLELFRQLDRTFVDPIFNDIYASGSTWEDNVESIAFLGQNGSVSHESPIDFNHDEKCVRFFDDFVIDSILPKAYDEAIRCVKQKRTFEFVWGLSSRSHAKEVPFMNVVCLEMRNQGGQKGVHIDKNLSTPSDQSKNFSTASMSTIGNAENLTDEVVGKNQRETSLKHLIDLANSPNTSNPPQGRCEDKNKPCINDTEEQKARIERRKKLLGLADAQNVTESKTNDERAISLYKMALNSYHEGDYSNAAKLFRQASDCGLADATGKLGECYMRGHGVKRNWRKGLSLLREAAINGSEFAKVLLRSIKKTIAILAVFIILCLSIGFMFWPDTSNASVPNNPNNPTP